MILFMAAFMLTVNYSQTSKVMNDDLGYCIMADIVFYGNYQIHGLFDKVVAC